MFDISINYVQAFKKFGACYIIKIQGISSATSKFVTAVILEFKDARFHRS